MPIIVGGVNITDVVVSGSNITEVVEKNSITGAETVVWTAVGWKTLISTYTNYSRGAHNLTGSKEATLTKITFRGKISNDFDGFDISLRLDSESSNGLYTGSGSTTRDYGEEYYEIEYGFELQFYNGYLEFRPYGHWYEAYSGHDGELTTTAAYVEIAKLEQYY